MDEEVLGPGVSPLAMAALCKAAAALFRQKPWTMVPETDNCLLLSIAELGISEVAVNVTGQWSDVRGLQVFADYAAYETYQNGADDLGPSVMTQSPSWLALYAEFVDCAWPAWADEIEERGWEVASDDAYPYAVGMMPGATRPLTVNEIVLLEAAALGLARVLIEPQALLAAWSGGPAVSYTFTVATQAGELTVTLAAPHERERIEAEPAHERLRALAALPQTLEGLNKGAGAQARAMHETELLCQFLASPEGQGVNGGAYCKLLMQLAAAHVVHTIGTLRALHLRSLVFHSMAREPALTVAEAPQVIAELRAFYQFLKRECRLVQAEPCLQLLDENAPQRLEAEIVFWRSGGMATSVRVAPAETSSVVVCGGAGRPVEHAPPTAPAKRS